MALQENSFIADISLDFEQSVAQAKEFSDSIDSIVAKFDALSNKVKETNINVSKLIKTEVQKINAGDIKVDVARIIQEKIEKTIEKSFADNINIKLMPGEITLNEKQQQKIASKARQLVVDAASQLELGKVKIGKMSFNENNLAILKQSLERQINERLQLDDFIKIDENFSIQATNETIAKLFEQVNKKLDDEIKNIVSLSEAFQTLNVGSLQKFISSIKNIQTSLDVLNPELENLKSLEKYDNVKKALVSFRENYNLLNTKFEELINSLEGLMQTVDTKVLNEINKIFIMLNNVILNNLSTSLEAIQNELVKLPEGTLKISQYKKLVKKIQTIVSNEIDAQIKKIISEYESAIGTVFVDVGGKTINVSALSTLQNKLIKAVNKALSSIDFSQFKIDSSNISTLVNEWSLKLSQDITEFIKSIATSFNIVDEMLKTTYPLITNLINSYFEQIKSELGKEITVPKISVSDVEKLLGTRIQKLVKDAIKNAVIEFSSDGGISVKVSKNDMKNIENYLRASITNYIEKLSQNLRELSGLNYDESINALRKTIETESERIVSNVAGQIENNIINLFIKLNEIRIENIANEQKNAFVRQYEEAIISFIANVYRGIETVIKIIVSLNSLTEAIIGQLRLYFENIDRNLLEIKALNFNIDFVSVINKVIKNVEKIIKNTILSSVDFDNIQLNITPLTMPVDTAVNKLIKLYGQKICNEIDAYIGKLNGTSAQSVSTVNVGEVITKIDSVVFKYLYNYVNIVSSTFSVLASEPNIKIPLESLSSDVRRAIARYFDVSVNELNKAFKELEGESGLKLVAQESVNVVVNKFNSSLMRVLNQVVSMNVEALDEVVVPDTSLVSFLRTKLIDLQKDIVEKIRKVLDQQFKLLKKEIRNLRVEPYSLNYHEPVVISSTKSVSGGGAGKGTSSILTNNLTSKDLDSILGKYLKEDSVVHESGSALTYRNMRGAILNTIRYMTAGSIVGVPSFLFWEAYDSAKQFDQYLEMARQNFLLKDSTMRTVAEQVVEEKYKNKEIPASQYYNEAERKKLIEDTANDLVRMTRDGVVKELQKYAMMYGLNQEDVGTAWYIASRRLDNPYEALPVAKNIAKLYSFERDASPEDLATGLEAILSQWSLPGQAASRIADMLIKADAMSQASVKDLIEIQKRAGAVFAANMPGATKEDAFATSLALSSLFIQSTARSGADAGTFWKTVFVAPFSGRAAAYLKQKSLVPGFEMLSPFVATKLPNGQVVEEQKSGLQMFLDILSAMKKMSPEDRQELIYKVYGERFGYGVEALRAVIEDMNNAVDKMDIKSFIEAIKNVKPEDINKAIIARQDTWVYNTQKLKTMWDAAFFNVTDQLKSEFTTVIDGLAEFLRIVKDNASLLASLIKLGTNIAMGAGIKWLFGKVSAYADKIEKQSLEESAIKNFSALRSESQFLNLKKLALYEDLKRYEEGIMHIQTRKAEVYEPYNRYRKVQVEIQQKMNELSDSVSGKKLINRDAYLQSLQKEYARVSKEVDRYKKQLDALDNMENRYIEAQEKVKNSLMQVDKEMADVINRAQLLDMAYSELGVKGQSLTSSVTALDLGLKTGTYSIEQMDLKIKELASSLGMSDFSLRTFSKDIDTLVSKFKMGEINANEFALAIKNLERAYKLNKLGVYNTNVTPEELINTVTARSLYKDIMENSEAKKSTSLIDKLGMVGLSLPFVGKIIKSRRGAGAVSEVAQIGEEVAKSSRLSKIISGTGSFISKFGKIGGRFLNIAKIGLRQVPELALWTAGVDIIGDILGGVFATPSERLSQKANKQKDLLNLIQNTANANLLGKIINAGVILPYHTITGSISSLLGGTAPSFKDYINAWKALFSGKNALDKYVQQQLDKINTDLAKAETLAEEENKDNGLKAKVGTTDWANVEDFGGSGSVSTALSNKYDLLLADLHTKFREEQAKLIIQGYSEDSQKMRDLMESFLKNNIEILKQAVSELEIQKEAIEKAYPNSYKNEQEWLALANEINDKKAQIAEAEIELENEKFSEFDAIINKLNYNKALTEAQFNISRSNLLLGGADENSVSVKNIEKNQLLKQNEYINQAISQLKALMNNYAEGDSRRDKIFLQIMQLQAESKDNLVKIYKTLAGSKSTFNLPSDIKPLTYWEAMTKANTHNNVTVRSGDVIVNVTIDNMTGSQRDVQKVTDVITNTVRNIQAGLADSLTRQVKSGMASSYRPIY